jgi:hypothetical protein
MRNIVTNEEYSDRRRINNRKWSQSNSGRNYYERTKDRRNLLAFERQTAYAKSWIGIIPTVTQCEICSKEVYFQYENNDIKRRQQIAINFDHKTGNELIKGSPTTWLRTHKRNLKNEAIWKSCNFGMLCGTCNGKLPTKNRREFLIKALEYTIGGDV